MKCLVIDPKGVALDWCMRAQNDGHDIKWWMQSNDKTKWIGYGLVTKVKYWQDHETWADLIFIADNTHWLRDLDGVRDRGTPVFGPTSALADLELERDDGQDLFKKHGIPTLEGECFTDYDKAIAYVKKGMKRYVSKPSGDADKSLSYVSKSPADMVYMLERWKKNGKMKSAPFILQDFTAGTEMAVGAFMGKAGFNEGWCENWEFKKLMNGELGPQTGEQGSVIRFVKKSKLADKVLKPLEGWLVRQGYTGYIDVNCIIDDKGTPWPLEFTCRPGWPTFNIQQALFNGDHAQWMMDTIKGKDPKCFRQNEIAVGVVTAIPDYPYSHATRKDVVGIPIYGIKPSIVSWLHPCELMMGKAPMEVAGKIVEKPMYVTAGDYLMVCSGVGETILQAKQKAYRVTKCLEIPNSPMYRTDIGDRLKKQLPKLQSQGYAMGMAWDAPNA